MHWFVPHSNGRIVSVSAVQMATTDLSLVTLNMYKYTGGSSGSPQDIADYDAPYPIGIWATGINGLDKYDPVVVEPVSASGAALEKGQGYIFVVSLNSIDVNGCNIHFDILIEEDD